MKNWIGKSIPLFGLLLMVGIIVACASPTPTPAPTAVPTKAAPPTAAPLPTTAPSPTAVAKATTAPTVAPTTAPTVAPTKSPTTAPTVAPTTAPTTAPTVAPTTAPTTAPTRVATAAATVAATTTVTSTVTVTATTSASTKPSGVVAVPTLKPGIPQDMEAMQRVKPEELKALIDAKADIVVVDAQPKSAYDAGHIPTAVNLPWDMKIKSAGGLPKDKVLVIYCACTHEEDAGDIGMQLITNFGYKNIMLLDGGWIKWVELGYPQEKK